MGAICQYYLKSKGRSCRAPAKPGCAYCGNHLSFATGTEERIPCPFDPTHHILKGTVEEHRRKCPFLRQQEKIQAQPFCRPDCNAGDRPPPQLDSFQAREPDNGDGNGDAAENSDAASPSNGRGGTPGRTARRVEYVRRMGRNGLNQLIHKVHIALRQVCPLEEQTRTIQPPECEPFFQPDNINPFSLRHAMQQASIIGNARRFGLLEEEEELAVVEFGAGKGYLSCMLSNCSRANRFLLVDNQSFRRKAERFLRKAVEVERLRVDIKDFDPAGLRQLQQPAARWIALGKHLCGAATDFTLRCCGRLAGDGGPPASGLAVATCCHHRCCWEHFTGASVFLGLGFLPEEFEIVSWMTGWALCGHEAPTGTAPEETGEPESESPGTAPEAEGSGPQASYATQRGGSKKRREAEARARATEVFQQQQQGSDDKAAVQTAIDSEASGAVSHANGVCGGGQGAVGLEGDGRQQDEEEEGGRFPAADIPRAARIAAGQMCKRLIDHCRAEYLRQQGFQVEVVLYVPDAISGENRLLLAAPPKSSA